MASTSTSTNTAARSKASMFADLKEGKDRYTMVYPLYVDKNKTIANGRKVPVASACEKPTAVEIEMICQHLKLPCYVEVRALCVCTLQTWILCPVSCVPNAGFQGRCIIWDKPFTSMKPGIRDTEQDTGFSFDSGSQCTYTQHVMAVSSRTSCVRVDEIASTYRILHYNWSILNNERKPCKCLTINLNGIYLRTCTCTCTCRAGILMVSTYTSGHLIGVCIILYLDT